MTPQEEERHCRGAMFYYPINLSFCLYVSSRLRTEMKRKLELRDTSSSYNMPVISPGNFKDWNNNKKCLGMHVRIKDF